MFEVVLPAIVISVLILVNGLFVAAEFAIAGVSRPAMEAEAQAGNRVAGLVAAMLRDPRRQDQYIATAQLGITFATLGLGMYGEHQLARGVYSVLGDSGVPAFVTSHVVASVIAVTIITYFHVVVGEMVPKALALQRPERAALWVTPPMLWIRKAAILLVLALNGMGNGILRVFGIRREAGIEQQYTSAELQFIIRESAELGELQQTSAEVLEDLFEFAGLDAESVMVPRVRIRGIPLDATNDDLLGMVQEHPHSRYPVYDGNLDNISGMLHIKDIIRADGDSGPLVRSKLRPVPFVPSTTSADAVLEIMRRERTQLVIVLDEHGGTAGLVTMEDLVAEVMSPVDESAAAADLFVAVNGRIHVRGTARLSQVAEHFERVLEHPEVETVSGLVLMLLDRPPRVGDVVEYGGLRFAVTLVAGRGVGECVVSQMRDSSATG